MNLLLDSHALLWWLDESSILSNEAYRAIDAASCVSVSLVTPWELQIKANSGKLTLTPDWHGLHQEGIETLDLALDDVLVAAALPLHHRDPFDRLMIAQALRRGLVIVTRDRHFLQYGVPMIWA